MFTLNRFELKRKIHELNPHLVITFSIKDNEDYICINNKEYNLAKFNTKNEDCLARDIIAFCVNEAYKFSNN